MMDREKVKKGLEIILNGCDEIQCEDCCFHIKEPTKPRRCGMIEEQIQEGALALLKEQQQQIWEFQDQVEYLTDKQKEQKFLVDSDGKITPLPVVVRCKDCKKRYTVLCIQEEAGNINNQDDWFCADGQRK